MAPCSAEEMLARSRAGEPDAFASLVRLHQRSVFSLALRMLGNRELAEDLAQEVFLQLHRMLDTIASPSHLQFWLRKVTTHRAIDSMRRRPASEQPLEEADVDHLHEAVSQPGDPMLQRHLESLIMQLPPAPRAVLLLRYQEDLDPIEIGSVLDMPVNTVKSHLKRSLATLRERFGLEGAATDAADVE
jgi:RNA polymerase sigma-70 factor (ECF subfamily)